MRQHLSICLQNMTGHRGPFSQEAEEFWRDVELKYKACNVMQVPQESIPIWYEIFEDRGISLAPRPKAAEKVDLRTKEGRAMKAAEPVGV